MSPMDSGAILLHRIIREAARPGHEEEEEEVTGHPRERTHTGGRHHKGTPAPKSRHHVATAAETEGTFTRMQHEADEVLHKVADKSHIPFWGILLILLVIVLVILVAFYFCLAKYWRKFRESDKGAKFKGLDLKSVNLIGQLGKEKVQPESENLTSNMETNEEDQKDDGPKEEVKLGRLNYKLDYDFNSTAVSTLSSCVPRGSNGRLLQLTVGVIQAEDLPACDAGGTSDPYCKVYLLPDKKKKFETKVHRKTLNPVFNENFVFKVPYNEIVTKTLVFAVFDFDRFVAYAR